MAKDKVLTDKSRPSRFGHWVRVMVMFLSFGFIFPHAMTENTEITEQIADQKSRAQ